MRFLLLFFSIIILSNCSTSFEQPQPFTFSDFPVVKTMVITDQYGTPVGIWHNPGYSLTLRTSNSDADNIVQNIAILNSEINETIGGDTEPIPNESGISGPRPNPSSNHFHMVLNLMARSVVSIWIVPARISTTESINKEIFSTHLFLSEKGIIVRELYETQEFNAGRHLIEWDLTDNKGYTIPAGFYRIYATIIDQTFYHDVLIYYDPSTLPEDIRKMIHLD